MEDEDPENLAQGAVERLSEDESLRGNLTDEGFGPLLDWASYAAIAYAKKINSGNPEDAMDNYATRLKTLIQAVVEDAEKGKIEDPNPLLDFITPDRNKVQDQLRGLKLSRDQDENARKIVEILTNALNSKSPTSETPNLEKEENPRKTATPGANQPGNSKNSSPESFKDPATNSKQEPGSPVQTNGPGTPQLHISHTNGLSGKQSKGSNYRPKGRGKK